MKGKLAFTFQSNHGVLDSAASLFNQSEWTLHAGSLYDNELMSAIGLLSQLTLSHGR